MEFFSIAIGFISGLLLSISNIKLRQTKLLNYRNMNCISSLMIYITGIFGLQQTNCTM
jgi:hypothetical protein